MNVDIYPEKAQYRTKETITIIIETENSKESDWLDQKAVLSVTHLGKCIWEELVQIGRERTIYHSKGIDTDFGGYGVYLTLQNKDKSITAHTSFDVVEKSSRSIRYGFLSDFDTKDGKDQKDVEFLRKFHINMVQYYDWSYRHDKLVSEEQSVYTDMMGRRVDMDTVRKKIAACRKFGMKSLGYGAVYAASKEYFQQHKEESLYTSAGDPLVFIDIFHIMNVSAGSTWRQHIISEYENAVRLAGFDGIHMDTYGFPKTAFAYQKEKLIHLEDEYKGLIEETKAALEHKNQTSHLIFNNVGNWPVSTVADAPQDALYIEVWEPNSTYAHIKQIILDAKKAGRESKPVILAAYLAPFRLEEEGRAESAACLLTAAIISNGAYHLLLGEERGVLTQGYYVDHSTMSASTCNKLRGFYDFLVQYMELFYDEELQDVSMTHMGWDNTEYHCQSGKWSVDAKPDTVWLTIREKEKRKLISMVNLCGNEETKWNLGKEKPAFQKNIIFQVQIDYPVAGIYEISPDRNQAKAKELPFEMIHTDRGLAIRFTVSELEYLTCVWIDF